MSKLLEICSNEAVLTALDEAKATPIEIGKIVGHTDFATFGTKTGKLIEYDGDEAVVERPDGETFRWKSEGMVDITRFIVLLDQYMRRMQLLLTDLVGFMDMIGVPPQETIATLLGPEGPTPGCDCPHCMTFSQEERDAAAAKLNAEPEGSTVADAPNGPLDFLGALNKAAFNPGSVN